MPETIQTNLVGAHFRPPAKALLAVLPAGHPLWLRPEPTNEYDGNAVRVVLRTDSLPTDEFLQDELETQLAGQGYDLQTIHEADEWHLGYLPRAAKGNVELEQWNMQVQLAIHEVAHGEAVVPCTLSFDSSGKPTLIIPWPPVAQEMPTTEPTNSSE